MFSTPKLADRWRETRREVLFHLLQIVSESPLYDYLVLRGSLLLKEWFGDEAREPGDIDWVLRPSTLNMQDRRAKALFEVLEQAVREQPNVGEAWIDVAHIEVEDIWTYDRAPGRRITLPWHVKGLPSGAVQMDVVFGEDLWTPPVETVLTLPGKMTALVWAVDRELSLAWKLLWLETDRSPQGKDLYDATLLAEHTGLSLRLLRKVLQGGDRPPNTDLAPDFPMKWRVNWGDFQREYPWVKGRPGSWKERLTTALAPTFTKP